MSIYPNLLALHSLVRWLVLLSLSFAVFRAYRGWLTKHDFSKFDNAIRHWAAIIAQLQLVLGLFLYFISPIVDYFWHNFNVAVHQREIRFFGMEHSLMMVIAVILITLGSIKTKRRQTDGEKYKTMAVWFTIALLIILSSIPWAFSPLTARPHFRSF